MAQIACKGVTLGYEGKPVVRNLNFEVKKGDYLCIVGENGSGKSTLIKALLKLKTPMEGSIVMGEGLLASEIGYLPQQTIVQRDFPASVREIVLSGVLNSCGMRPFYGKREKERAERSMELLKITDIAGKCYRELSGGQQQRVLLARALCATSKLLLLDEPVAGLDPVVSKELYEVIEQLNKEQKITISNSSNLSEQDIDRMVKEAESNAEEDKKKKEEAEVKNNANSLITAVDRLFKDFEGKISDSDKEKLEEQKKALEDALKENKSADEIKIMREAGVINAEALRAAADACVPGNSTWDVNAAADAVLKKYHVVSAFKGVPGPIPYPSSTCGSVNNILVHGIPSKNVVLKEGDIVSIDCGATLKGYVERKGDMKKETLRRRKKLSAAERMIIL